MNLILIRHGQTEWNIQKREMGHLDSPLTSLGIQQAQAIAKRLRLLPVSAIYSSNLGRAVQTANVISSATGIRVNLDQGLRERNMGILQGMTRQEMATRFPQEYSHYRADSHSYVIPEGESGEQRTARSVRILTALAEKHPDETVVAVSHSGFISGFFEYVLAIPPNNGWRYQRSNAAFNQFRHDAGSWSLVTWNDTGHFDNLK